MASYVRFYCLKVGNGLLILLQKKAKRKKGGGGWGYGIPRGIKEIAGIS